MKFYLSLSPLSIETLSQMFLLMSLGRDKDGPYSDGSAQNLVPWVSLQQEQKHATSGCSSVSVSESMAWAGRGWEISLEAHSSGRGCRGGCQVRVLGRQ